MFAYCGNAPALRADSQGEYYTPAEIHNFVVKDICCHTPGLLYQNTIIDYIVPIIKDFSHMSTYGFCDIFSIETGEVWEVKRFGGGATCTLYSASAQLSNYVENGVLRYHEDLDLKKGGAITDIPANTFAVLDRDGSGYYNITYWDTGEGVVFYDYFYTPSREEVAYAACIACVSLLIYLSGGALGAAGPVLLPA